MEKITIAGKTRVLIINGYHCDEERLIVQVISEEDNLAELEALLVENNLSEVLVLNSVDETIESLSGYIQLSELSKSIDITTIVDNEESTVDVIRIVLKKKSEVEILTEKIAELEASSS